MNNRTAIRSPSKENISQREVNDTYRSHYQSIWISDIHLGFKDCKSEYLINFLQSTESNTLYLVGDIIDLWSMKKNFYWSDSHYQVLQEIQKKVEQGTKVIYIPGNHDITLRNYINKTIMGVEVHQHFIHRSSNGKRYLIMHGDEFDHATRYNQLISIIGDSAYDFLLFLNRWTNRFRTITGNNYWSLASWLKIKVSKAREAIESFENAAIHEARKHGVDGIICGHIHHPVIKQDKNITYVNDGDWVENCTALVENNLGDINLIHWSSLKKHTNQIIDKPKQFKANKL